MPTHVAEGIPYVCMASRKPTAARWLGQCPRHLLLFPTTASAAAAAAAASNVDGMEVEIEKDGRQELERREGGRVPQEMGGGREKRKFAVHFMISPTVCESDTPLSLSAFSPSQRKRMRQSGERVCWVAVGYVRRDTLKRVALPIHALYIHITLAKRWRTV